MTEPIEDAPPPEAAAAPAAEPPGERGPEGDEPSMEFHKPRPVHSWREFLSEVGVVVLGIVIALGGEQVVQDLHWADEVRSARVSMHSEMRWANEVFAFRAAAEPCISRRLDQLDKVTEAAASHERAPSIGPVAVDVSNSIEDSAWQAHRASQTLIHFPKAELYLLGEYYMQLGTVRDLILREIPQWSELAVLQGDPRRLGPDDFARIRQALHQARDYNRLIALISREELDRSRRLHLEPPAANAARLKLVCAAQPMSSPS